MTVGGGSSERVGLRRWLPFTRRGDICAALKVLMGVPMRPFPIYGVFSQVMHLVRSPPTLCCEVEMTIWSAPGLSGWRFDRPAQVSENPITKPARWASVSSGRRAVNSSLCCSACGIVGGLGFVRFAVCVGALTLYEGRCAWADW